MFNNSRLLRYVLMGGVAYLSEMGTLFLLHGMLGLNSIGSVAISFWVGFIVAFILQKHLTFRNFDWGLSKITRQIVIYGVLVAWNYGFTILLALVFSNRVSIYIIRTITIVIVTIWNYLIYRYIFQVNTESSKIHE